jgi:NAD(P)-dependent dehydrogenase (short-subunit alcohol dehydrogenase family)
MRYPLDGKVAIVTGGASGIGKETALAFARSGAHVMIADMNPDQGEAVAAEIKASGGASKFCKTDVSSAADVQNLVAQTIAAFGRLDFAFNNAGVNDVMKDEWDEAVFTRALNVNLTGVMLCMKFEIDQMLKQGQGGAIVNTASINGIVGNGRQPAYTASKHGVIGLTRTAALANGRAGIRVNAVCPGVIETPMSAQALALPGVADMMEKMTPLGRTGKPREIASAVLWLCSEESSFVTGHPLVIDGGVTAQ